MHVSAKKIHEKDIQNTGTNYLDEILIVYQEKTHCFICFQSSYINTSYITMFWDKSDIHDIK